MATKRRHRRVPWNKGKIVGQKAPLKLREIWAIRVRLQLRSNLRDLALFNLAIDSKLRACDLLGLRVGDIAHENHVNSRAVVMQRKTRRPVQFEITEMSRDALQAWTRAAGLRSSDFVFPEPAVQRFRAWLGRCAANVLEYRARAIRRPSATLRDELECGTNGQDDGWKISSGRTR